MQNASLTWASLEWIKWITLKATMSKPASHSSLMVFNLSASSDDLTLASLLMAFGRLFGSISSTLFLVGFDVAGFETVAVFEELGTDAEAVDDGIDEPVH